MKRRLLGRWRCPSGNAVDVFVVAGDGPVRRFECEWSEFPLTRTDQIFYTIVIAPEIARRAAEYLEKPGPALVVRV